MWRSMPPADAIRRCWRVLAQAARLAVGVPDYDTYVAHVRTHHPGRDPMDHQTFHAERMRARYGRGRSRCC